MTRIPSATGKEPPDIPTAKISDKVIAIEGQELLATIHIAAGNRAAFLVTVFENWQLKSRLVAITASRNNGWLR